MPDSPDAGYVVYEDIPLEPRKVLDEVYDEPGVELWWNARNKLFGGIRARDVWRVSTDRVMSVANMLADGNFG